MRGGVIAGSLGLPAYPAFAEVDALSYGEDARIEARIDASGFVGIVGLGARVNGEASGGLVRFATDGGAALVVSSLEWAAAHGHEDPVRVAGISTVGPTYPNSIRL